MATEKAVPPIDELIYYYRDQERGYPASSIDDKKIAHVAKTLSIDSVRDALKTPLDAGRVITALKVYPLLDLSAEARPNDIDNSIFSFLDSKISYTAEPPEEFRSGKPNCSPYMTFNLEGEAWLCLTYCVRNAHLSQHKSFGIMILDAILSRDKDRSAAMKFEAITLPQAQENQPSNDRMLEFGKYIFQLLSAKDRPLELRMKVPKIFGILYPHKDQRGRGPLEEMLMLNVGILNTILNDPSEDESLRSEVRWMVSKIPPLVELLQKSGAISAAPIPRISAFCEWNGIRPELSIDEVANSISVNDVLKVLKNPKDYDEEVVFTAIFSTPNKSCVSHRTELIEALIPLTKGRQPTALSPTPKATNFRLHCHAAREFLRAINSQHLRQIPEADQQYVRSVFKNVGDWGDGDFSASGVPTEGLLKLMLPPYVKPKLELVEYIAALMQEKQRHPAFRLDCAFALYPLTIRPDPALLKNAAAAVCVELRDHPAFSRIEYVDKRHYSSSTPTYRSRCDYLLKLHEKGFYTKKR